MIRRAALAALIVGAIAAQAQAASVAPKKAPPATAKPAPPAPAAEGDDLATAGKVIEIDTSGKAKVVKGADGVEVTVGGEALTAPPAAGDKAPKAADLTVGEACRIRSQAQCELLRRCGGVPMDCQALAGACPPSAEAAAFTRKDAEACAKGVAALACDALNMAGLSFDPEAQVPACQAVLEPAKAEPKAPEPKGKAGSKAPPTKVDGLDFHEIDLGGVLGGADPGE